jgi:para-nitrobenzyl esterase
MKNILFFILLCLLISTNAQNALVKTANGKIQGTTTTDKTVRIFRGIPFAAPPVGDLR